ncbi:MAG: TVP38/TMEM64 family protein [candidate division NC10 bacterium]|nr:TVP38/TMEM64 family protein [candidate division NC10 bacterium]
MGALGFTAIYATAAACGVPGTILTLAAGFVFGEAYGTVVGLTIASLTAFVGASIGACIAFLIARYVLHAVVERKAQKYSVTRAINGALAATGNGLRLVFLLRLSPIVPYNVLNYFMGITAVRFKEFLAACVGMLPGAVAYAYFGTLLSNAKAAAEGNAGGNNAIVRWIFLGLGVVATIAAIVLVTVYARRHLQRTLELEPVSETRK